MERLNRAELLKEIEKRDDLIDKLKAEIQQYREGVSGRKIAVSAPKSDCNIDMVECDNLKFYYKEKKTFDIIESTLLANEFFCQLEKCEIEKLICSMYPVDAAIGSSIIRQGEYGSVLYVLEEGRVQVTKDERFIRIMDAPCIFGELAILYHCERTASVKALTTCRIWAIDRQIFHSIMVNTAKSKHNTTIAYLKRCKYFSLFTDDQINIIANIAKEEFWKFRTEVYKTQLSEQIYVITKGRLTLRRSNNINNTLTGPDFKNLSCGDIFGEINLFKSFILSNQIGNDKCMNNQVTNVLTSRKATLPKTPVQQKFIKQNTINSINTNTNNKVDFGNIISDLDSNNLSENDCYFVDSVEGCNLLVMYVDQLIKSLDLSLNSLNTKQMTNMPHSISPSISSNSNQISNQNVCHKLNKHNSRKTIYSSKSVNKTNSIEDVYNQDSCSDNSYNSNNKISDDNNIDSDDDSYTSLELTDLKTISTLGIGGFGRVNLVKRYNNDNKVYALKILNKAHLLEMNQQEHVLNERNILILCRSDFIIRLYKTYRDAERLYMLLEYCPGGEVWTMLHKWGRFDENTARFYCAAALEAFDYLHCRFIIYRDLKPENMLLDKNGIPKLADFGFAKRLKSAVDRTWTFCGTAEYVCPEIILNKGQDTAVDIWSLGIFMYELISGTPPFASTDPMHTYNSILRGVKVLAWPRYMSESAKNLICKFCHRNPTQRLGYGRIDDARNDPWFNSFDFESFRNHTMRPPIIPEVHSPTDTQNFDRYPSMDNFLSGIDESGWDANF